MPSTSTTRPWYTRPGVTVPARLLLGLVFIYASFDKLLHPADFAETVYRYRLMPDELVNLTAIVLPWLECVLGLSLVLGIGLPGSALLSAALLTVFVAALGFNLARGLDVNCGCFSTGGDDPATVVTLLRDGLLPVPAVVLLLAVFRRPAAAR